MSTHHSTPSTAHPTATSAPVPTLRSFPSTEENLGLSVHLVHGFFLFLGVVPTFHASPSTVRGAFGGRSGWGSALKEEIV